jgi:hypothetical protein
MVLALSRPNRQLRLRLRRPRRHIPRATTDKMVLESWLQQLARLVYNHSMLQQARNCAKHSIAYPTAGCAPGRKHMSSKCLGNARNWNCSTRGFVRHPCRHRTFSFLEELMVESGICARSRQTKHTRCRAGYTNIHEFQLNIGAIMRTLLLIRCLATNDKRRQANQGNRYTDCKATVAHTSGPTRPALYPLSYLLSEQVGP